VEKNTQERLVPDTFERGWSASTSRYV